MSPPSIPSARCPTPSPSSTSIPAPRATRRSSARSTMPNAGDELHHFGWNACSSCLCPNAPHPHVERRYLVVPGLRSSRIHILDTKPDPQAAQDRQGDRAGGGGRAGRLYAARTPSTADPKASMSPRSATREGKAPGGMFLMDHETFDVRGQWEIDRGPQQLRLRCLVAPRPRHAWSPANGARPTRSRTG